MLRHGPPARRSGERGLAAALTDERRPRTALRIGAILLFSAALAACGEGARARPNLLLVLLDTTRADHLGCYGRAGATSPAIDALAAGGARFEAAYAQSSLTPVSAGSILTGAYPFRHGIRSLFAVGRQTLSPEITTLGELLARHGIRSAAFVSAMPMGARYGFGRGFDEYHDDAGELGARNRELRLANPNQRRADATTDDVLAWLAAHAGERFALFVHFFDAHDATLVPPREFLEGRISFAPPGALEMDAAPSEQRIELYDAEIAFMDAQLARILARLREAGVLENTLIVVIGDHGEGLGQHGFWTHGLLYDEQLRVPFVIAGPGVPEGTVVPDRVRMVDLLPTLVELLDLGAAKILDGSSLTRLLEGRSDAQARELYAEVHHAEPDFLGRDPALFTLAIGPWKYIHRPGGASELYDSATDPGETRNLYAPDHPALPDLRARLDALGALKGHEVSTEGLAEDDLEALRQLGYLRDREADDEPGR